MFLLYLDQNYASRIAKYLLHQPDQEPFDRLYHRLLTLDIVVPPSPFHVFELRGGYLTPPFHFFFEDLRKGFFVRPWEDILQAQIDRLTADPSACAVVREDFLIPRSSWEGVRPAALEPFSFLLSLHLDGPFPSRLRQAGYALAMAFSIRLSDPMLLPFVRVLSHLLTWRSLNPERSPSSSDLADLVIAATVLPYVDIFATDRFVREAIVRKNLHPATFSGRVSDALRLLDTLDTLFPSTRSKAGG